MLRGIASRLSLAFSPRRAIEIGGLRLPLDTSNVHERRYYEASRMGVRPVEAQIAESFMRKGDIVLDAGANIGASAIYFARRYPNARIFALEPEQENYDLLLRNTHRYHNIIPIKAALWGQGKPPGIYSMEDVLGL